MASGAMAAVSIDGHYSGLAKIDFFDGFKCITMPRTGSSTLKLCSDMDQYDPSGVKCPLGSWLLFLWWLLYSGLVENGVFWGFWPKGRPPTACRTSWCHLRDPWTHLCRREKELGRWLVLGWIGVELSPVFLL